MIRAIIGILPAWFRFAQCIRRYRDTREAFPHLVNAGKYSTGFFVALFSSLNAYYEITYPDIYGPGKVSSGHSVGTISRNFHDFFSFQTLSVFFYFWMIARLINASYTYTWDIKMDWGLMAKNAGENTFLREEFVYSSKGYYYFAIFEDFVLRYAWSISIALKYKGYLTIENSEWVVTILALFEVIRRFIWNFFRLENEHLNNCGKFRAVRDISVAPIDTNDQTDIIKIMDEPDGILKIREKKSAKERKKSKAGPELLKPLLENEKFSTLAAAI